MEQHIYNLGVIGNCAFLAHIDKSTNIAWMCWPRFDSSFIFGQLLDKKKGGEFSILPDDDDYSSDQYYIENTNILRTEITSQSGKYRVTDVAPRFFQFERYFRPLMLIRKIEPLEGNPRIKVTCRPTYNYGQHTPEKRRGSSHIEFSGYEDHFRLTTDISLSHIMEENYFVLNEPKYLVMTYGVPLEAPLVSTAEEFLRRTIQYWRGWVKSTSITDFYQTAVIRSALVLKIHQYEDTGAIIAAATTSLPEFPGSGRNWDYRYCWLRDTYYILTAFNNIGHFEEMEKYFQYIANISSTTKQGRYQPLYSLSGKEDLDEHLLDLEGYLGNTPVRLGNQAYTHIQNDVYGQVLISLLPLYSDERFIHSERIRSPQLINNTLNKIHEIMEEPDAGLWEFRNFSQYHCYTYLFHWAGAKAGHKIAQRLGDKKMALLADKVMKAAANKIESCYIPESRAYSQAIGNTNMDASTLQLIMMNYLDPNSQRALDHLSWLEQGLKTKEGLFYRYKHADDFGLPESTFLICAFWYVEALACVGKVDEAAKEFEKLLSYTNHLGLLSEDVHAESGSQWGNFPQAYSHVGLVNAAFKITNKMDRPNFL